MRKTNKIKKTVSVLVILTLLILTCTACGKSEFGMTNSTEKHITIQAINAQKNATFMGGTLEVDEGERIEITSELKGGSVSIELFNESAEQSADAFPEIDGEAAFTAILGDISDEEIKTETLTGQVPAGTYIMKATCLEKATGTIQIDVLS